MDVTQLVMVAGLKWKVHATGAQSYHGSSVELYAITFDSAEDAKTFAAGCMGDGIPAQYAGPQGLLIEDGKHTAVVMNVVH